MSMGGNRLVGKVLLTLFAGEKEETVVEDVGSLITLLLAVAVDDDEQG